LAMLRTVHRGGRQTAEQLQLGAVGMRVVGIEDASRVKRVGRQPEVEDTHRVLHKPSHCVVLKALILDVPIVGDGAVLAGWVPVAAVAEVAVPAAKLANDNGHVTALVPEVVAPQPAEIVWEVVGAAGALRLLLRTPAGSVEVRLVGVDRGAVDVGRVDELRRIV